jgi:hypothetical protein
MGIKDYHGWIRSAFPTCLIDTTKNNIYDYIYIDMNYILYYAIYGCKTQDEFIKNIYFNLDIIFSNFIATKKIFFALDGTPAYAKIILQRERRNNQNPSLIKTNPTTSSSIDHLGLSVGTKMMQKIEQHIQNYITILQTQYKYTNPEITFSKSSECGEGEIKICKEIITNGTQNLTHTHLIIGNDADIIVLSMGAKPVYNVNILVNESGNKNRVLMSLKILLELWPKSLNKSHDIHIMANSDLRDDFVLVSLMMGNDYFPKLAYINYIKLWECYYQFSKETNNTIINNSEFNMANLQRFTQIIYSNLNNSYKHVTANTYNPNRVNSYFEGLLWCLKIYNTGVCTNYEYAYTGKKSVHPFELYIHTINNTIKSNQKYTLPISSSIYPILIMPSSAKHLIPKKYHSLVDNELKNIYDMENCVECKQLYSSCQIAKTKMNSCKSDRLLNKFKVVYREKYIEYNTHKKTHNSSFSINDIKYIVELCNKIK